MALLTTVILLFAAEGDSLASWHLRCCHGNSRGARQPLLLRQQAELQSQVHSSPAPRARPQVPSSWEGDQFSQARPPLHAPPGPNPPVTSHVHRLTLPSWGALPFLGGTPCIVLAPRPSLGRPLTSPAATVRAGRRAGQSRVGWRCCNRPGGRRENGCVGAWASRLLRTPCRLS